MAIIIERNSDGSRHRLREEETGAATEWATYRQFTYMNGQVGCTPYFTGGDDDVVQSAQEFCQMTGVQ